MCKRRCAGYGGGALRRTVRLEAKEHMTGLREEGRMRRRRIDEKPAVPGRGEPLDAKPATSAHRAALEALFAPKSAVIPDAAMKRETTRVITVPERGDDPVRKDRERLLERLLKAEGRPAITKAANEYVKAGHAFPADQEVHLQLLEHSSEDRVAESIALLDKLVEDEPVKRETVLDGRLRRLDEHAEFAATRELAADLRKKLARKKALR